MAVVFGLIWRPIVAVFKLLVWMLSATSLYLRKCTTHLTRLDSTRFGVYGSRYATTSRSSNMATVGEGADDKLVEKIAKNVVQNVKTKEVRHTSFQKKKKQTIFPVPLYFVIKFSKGLELFATVHPQNNKF